MSFHFLPFSFLNFGFKVYHQLTDCIPTKYTQIDKTSNVLVEPGCGLAACEINISC